MSRRSSSRVVGLVLLLLTLGGVLASPGAAQPAPTPAPEELCAALEGGPGYQECLDATRDALGGVDTGGTATTPTAVDGQDDGTDAPPDGRTLSEQSLEEQRQLLWIIVAVVLVGMFVLVALSWRRSMRRLRDTFSPETLALMESMIPPEVRAEHPDATVGDGLTEKERKLLRGQRNLVIALLVLPAAVFVLLQVWEPSVDTSVAIGEVARIAPLVLAIPAIWWARRRVTKALAAGEDRWSVLGLHPESGPGVTVLPRADGTLRAAVYGTTVLGGRRFGRAVRIEMGNGSVRTAVERPGMPDLAPRSEPGPGEAVLWAADGWVLLQRTTGGATLTGPDGLTIVLRDLQRVEQVAAGPVPA